MPLYSKGIRFRQQGCWAVSAHLEKRRPLNLPMPGPKMRGRALPTSRAPGKIRADGRRKMGQYYVASNVDRKEFIYLRSFGIGPKLTKTCYVGNSYVDALTHLIAKEWHGDTVVVCGDYAWGGGGSASARLHEVSSIDPWQRPGEERGGYVSVAIRSATSKEDVSSEGFQAVNPRYACGVYSLSRRAPSASRSALRSIIRCDSL